MTDEDDEDDGFEPRLTRLPVDVTSIVWGVIFSIGFIFVGIYVGLKEGNWWGIVVGVCLLAYTEYDHRQKFGYGLLSNQKKY